jgi:hypothetical protein
VAGWSVDDRSLGFCLEACCFRRLRGWTFYR